MGLTPPPSSSQIIMPIPTTHSRITLRSRPKHEIEAQLDGTGTFSLEKGVRILPDEGIKKGEVLVKVE